jgi:acyl dehydratase
MAINRAFVGRTYQADEVYEVGREKIRQFAEAIGDPNPAYRDREAARAFGHADVIAPPTFLTVLSFRFAGASPVADPDLGLDYSLVVHGEQRFVHHRPVRAGDRLSATTTVESIRDAGRNELLTLRTDIGTESGEAVATTYSTIVSRGTAAAGAAGTAK